MALVQKIRIRVAGLLVKDGRVLLVCHKKKNKKYWLLPGGGVDLGESLPEALVREFREELDIDIAVKDIVYVSDSISPHKKRHIVNVVFKCDYISGEYRLGADKRLFDFNFFLSEELDNLVLYPSFREELRAYIDEGMSRDVYLGSCWS